MLNFFLHLEDTATCNGSVDVVDCDRLVERSLIFMTIAIAYRKMADRVEWADALTEKLIDMFI